MNHSTSENDRLLSLLADQATLGLEAPEQRELAALLDASQDASDLEPMELAAAAADLAFLGQVGGASSLEPMPAALMASISAEAQRFTTGVAPPADATRSAAPTLQLARGADDVPLAPRLAESVAFRAGSVGVGGSGGGGWGGAGTGAWMGWLAAAACLAVAGSVWMSRPAAGPSGPGLTVGSGASTGRSGSIIIESVLARADTLQIDWKPLPDATCQEKCAGRVIWNNELQQGWMVFKGLAANDPAQFQYQLWIFDKNQKHPIDGGVFDIAQARLNAAGEVEVPIRAAIKVSDPQAFAVTVEKPGGVVVSDQTRIAVLAPVSKG